MFIWKYAAVYWQWKLSFKYWTYANWNYQKFLWKFAFREASKFILLQGTTFKPNHTKALAPFLLVVESVFLSLQFWCNISCQNKQLCNKYASHSPTSAIKNNFYPQAWIIVVWLRKIGRKFKIHLFGEAEFQINVVNSTLLFAKKICFWSFKECWQSKFTLSLA